MGQTEKLTTLRVEGSLRLADAELLNVPTLPTASAVDELLRQPTAVELSGATTPIEAMPDWMQPLTDLNPVKHFAVLARGVMLKGVGLVCLSKLHRALCVHCDPRRRERVAVSETVELML